MVSEIYTNLLRNVRDILGIKVFFIAVVVLFFVQKMRYGHYIKPNVTDITYYVFGNSVVATQNNRFNPAGKQCQ